jgi:hypothetical protein
MTYDQAMKTARSKAEHHGGSWIVLRRGDDYKVVDHDTWIREFWVFVDHTSGELLAAETGGKV